jgi:hypothetical protein
MFRNEVLVPIPILSFVLQREFIRELEGGALKG